MLIVPGQPQFLPGRTVSVRPDLRERSVQMPDKENDLFEIFGTKHRISKLLIPVFCILLVIFVVCPAILAFQLHDDWVTLDDVLSVDILRSDGTSGSYDGNTFPVVSRGDRLMVTVPLPSERMVEDAALCLNIYHASIRAYYGDELLFSHGTDLAAEGRFIGNTFLRVPLRDEMWGSQLLLVLDVTENYAFSGIQNTQVIPQLNSVHYFYGQYMFNIPVFFAIVVIFSLAFLVLLFFPKRMPLRAEGLTISLFCATLAFWYLAGNGFVFTMTENITLAAHLEYICIFLLPIPFCMFMYTQDKTNAFNRRFSIGATILFSVLFVVATILNYTTANFHYFFFLSPLQAFMLIGMTIFAFTLTRRQYIGDRSRKIIRYGVALSVIILLLELVRINVVKIFPGSNLFGNFSLTPLGMVIFSGALILGWLARLLHTLRNSQDKALLRRMAYVDVLTGISNRNYCHQQIQQMEEKGEKRFALLFFDLNGLKMANDTYGHDMGDRFIQCVAELLQKIFGRQEFCGRWGGDEFIVCLTGKNIRHVDKMLRDFDEDIRLVNESGQFPFRVSVAYGLVRSTEEESLSMDEALKEVDRRMYTAKLRTLDSRSGSERGSFAP